MIQGLQINIQRKLPIGLLHKTHGVNSYNDNENILFLCLNKTIVSISFEISMFNKEQTSLQANSDFEFLKTKLEIDKYHIRNVRIVKL